MANDDGHVGVCSPCGKRQYLTKTAAKAVVRRLDRDHVVAYRCPHEKRYWHVGHLPKPVIKGAVSRETFTRRADAQRV